MEETSLYILMNLLPFLLADFDFFIYGFSISFSFFFPFPKINPIFHFSSDSWASETNIEPNGETKYQIMELFSIISKIRHDIIHIKQK